jgi:DNA-binding CsgD family transcriptional regulator
VNGIGWAVTGARIALAELELGLGNARAAMAQFELAGASLFPAQRALATPGFIDAALRAGEREPAAAALAPFAAWASLSREPLVPGMVARCRGMLAPEAEDAERCFAEALGLHASAASPIELARTQLAYGERLRRDRRRVEARTQLREALAAFDAVEASLWAERARGELEATGQTARRRDPSTLDDLTPQELRIAQLVADGATNRDVAAQLFVSPKTVEYHLRKVYAKVGVRSRIELAGLRLE